MRGNVLNTLLQVCLQDLNWVLYLVSYRLYYVLKDKTSKNSAKKGRYLNAYFWHFWTLAPLLVLWQCFFYWSFLLIVFRGCLFRTDLSVPSTLVVTCWEKVLAPLFVMFTCVLVTFIFGVLGQVWLLIVSIPDICLLPDFCTFMPENCYRYWEFLTRNH